MPLDPRRLPGLLEQTPIDFVTADHVAGDHKVAHLALHGEVIHQLQHEVFENHAQAPRADLALKSHSATVSRASSVKRRRTFSNSKRRWYCLRSAFLGSVRIFMSAALSRSFMTPATGRRPTNSGISP